MRKLLLLFWLASCSWGWSQTIQEVQEDLRSRGQHWRSSLSDSWGDQQAGQDLQAILDVLDRLGGADAPWDHAFLHQQRQALSSGAQRLRISLSASTAAAGLQEWLTMLQPLEDRLDSLVKRFDGHQLLTRQQWLGTAWQRDLTLPEFQSPQELRRAARHLQQDARNLQYPWLFPVGGIGAYGPLGLGSGGTGLGQEIREFLRAVQRFDDACSRPYQDVSETRPAFEKMVRAFDRVDPTLRYQTSSFRSVQQAIERLQRFYDAL
jgi:hypothetical protein